MWHVPKGRVSTWKFRVIITSCSADLLQHLMICVSFYVYTRHSDQLTQVGCKLMLFIHKSWPSLSLVHSFGMHKCGLFCLIPHEIKVWSLSHSLPQRKDFNTLWLGSPVPHALELGNEAIPPSLTPSEPSQESTDLSCGFTYKWYTHGMKILLIRLSWSW